MCESYESYMTDQHIPDLMKTGFFATASFETCGEGEYQIRYEAFSRDDLDIYLRDHAALLRQDFASHFPNGISLSRKEWTVVRRYE